MAHLGTLTLDRIEAYRVATETLAVAATLMSKQGRPDAMRYAELALIMAEEYDALRASYNAVPALRSALGDNVVLFPVVKRNRIG